MRGKADALAYADQVKIVSLAELQDSLDAVLDAVEAGGMYCITRNGTEVAELRPVVQRSRPTTAELIDRRRRLPAVDDSGLRADGDAFPG